MKVKWPDRNSLWKGFVIFSAGVILGIVAVVRDYAVPIAVPTVPAVQEASEAIQCNVGCISETKDSIVIRWKENGFWKRLQFKAHYDEDHIYQDFDFIFVEETKKKGIVLFSSQGGYWGSFQKEVDINELTKKLAE